MSLKSFRLLPALPSAVIVAVMLLGGVQARAGYVTLPTMANHESGRSLAHYPISALGEFDGSSGRSDSSEASQSLPNENDPQLPTGPASPSQKLPHGAFIFDHATGSSTSSSSAPSSAPSSSAAGFSPRTQIPPPLERSSLLPPQTGDAHPFSVASFLFRPPRLVG